MALSERSDLALTYAALLLHDAGLNITADKLNTVLKAANIIDVPPFYPRLFSRVLANRNLDDLLFTVTAVAPSSGGAAAAGVAASGSAAGAASGAKEEEKKKEEKKPVEEDDDALDADGGMGLFGGDDDY